MTKAIYPGTFDPITKGHEDVIIRASRLFENLNVVVGYNLRKKTLFSVEERVALIKEVVRDIPNVSVSANNGLTVDYLRKHKTRVIIRGLRAFSDFEFEFQLSMVNTKLYKDCEMVYLLPREKYTYLNSSVIKEVAMMNGDISGFVSLPVEKALKAKLA
jgi:pantetheine-phosphate adenylyltransferase